MILRNNGKTSVPPITQFQECIQCRFTLSPLGKNLSTYFKIFLFFPENKFRHFKHTASNGDILQKKCQNLFSEKTKKNIISWPSAEYAQKVLKINCQDCSRVKEKHADTLLPKAFLFPAVTISICTMIKVESNDSSAAGKTPKSHMLIHVIMISIMQSRSWNQDDLFIANVKATCVCLGSVHTGPSSVHIVRLIAIFTSAHYFESVVAINDAQEWPLYQI